MGARRVDGEIRGAAASVASSVISASIGERPIDDHGFFAAPDDSSSH
jgi:hypothetical protein